MIVFRLTRAKHAQDLSGEGARRAGGRWNPAGVPALYTSKTISLALLEILVHVQDRTLMPSSYSVMEIEVPSDRILGVSQLPEHAFESQEIGGELLKNRQVLGFVAPSVLIPSEQNVVLNPYATDYALVKLIKHYPLQIDDRFR